MYLPRNISVIESYPSPKSGGSSRIMKPSVNPPATAFIHVLFRDSRNVSVKSATLVM